MCSNVLFSGVSFKAFGRGFAASSLGVEWRCRQFGACVQYPLGVILVCVLALVPRHVILLGTFVVNLVMLLLVVLSGSTSPRPCLDLRWDEPIKNNFEF